MKALVLADINIERLTSECPEIDFTILGYALPERIPLPHQELVAAISDFDILISEFDTVDCEVIDAATNLKLIICCRGGVRSVIDVDHAEENGILVKNTPARNANAVAEYVIGAIINADRHLCEASALVSDESLQKQSYHLPAEYRDSLWGMDKSSPYHVFRGAGLRNITLGVVGYGNIGETVVELANKLGMKVLVCDKHPERKQKPEGVLDVTFDYLLASSDYVSLHCNNSEGRILMGKTQFERMRNSAFFINTSRGNLVDEDALVAALDSGIISGAIIDVTRTEPLPLGSSLVKAKNLFITPHIAGATNEMVEIGTNMVIAHIQNFLSNISASRKEA